jgi:hypothetical protein
MNEHPRLSLIINGYRFNYKLFETLECVNKTWSQRKAAKKLGISHAVLNRRIKEAEEKLGFKLVDTTGAGSELTENAKTILRRHRNYMKRLKTREKPIICGGHISSGLLEVLSSKYGLDANIYQTKDENALYLADMEMVDILTLDDPIHAFRRDLNFRPIAYDHLVLTSGLNPIPYLNHLEELNGKKFIQITDSSQRLAWNTLDINKIGYKIVKQFKSPYNALKYLKNRELYTFLNKSLSTGSEIIGKDTRHVISVVICNRQEERLSNFLDFILAEGQEIIEKCGFERI